MQMTFGDPCERVVMTYKLRTTGSSPFVYLLPSWPVGFLTLLSTIPFPQKARLRDIFAQGHVHSGLSHLSLPVALPHIYNNLFLHHISLFYFSFFIHLQFRNPNDPVGGGLFELKSRLLAFVSVVV